jgi:hypothetical protein
MDYIKKPEKRRISPIYLTNKVSSTLIIPIKMAEKFHLNEPNTHVILEETGDGILIKKLKIGNE